ncbi:ABC transporter permease [Erysipelothrix sp. D19-032]
MHYSPGDPATLILGESATPQAIAQLRSEMGLDRPFLIQYFKYIGNAFLKFDLGRSFVNNRPVITEIMTRFPNTMKLAGYSILLAAVVGIPLGVLAARKPYSLWIMEQCLYHFWVYLCQHFGKGSYSSLSSHYNLNGSHPLDLNHGNKWSFQLLPLHQVQ